MEPAISVIIPMYNAEKYIGDCLTSLANQTFKDFEVIVADDCSTDNSCAVVEKFFSVFGGRLKLGKLSRNSGYPGIPRNFALEAARGKYVYFLDSDDLLIDTTLEKLYNTAENFNADVVHAESCFTFPDGAKKIDATPKSFQTGEFVTEPTLETFDLGQRVTDFARKRYVWWAWNKLIRRKLLSDNKITFPAIKTFEDFVFAFECLVAAKNYVRVPFVGYCYRVRDDSSSHKAGDGSDFMEILIKVVKSLDDFMNGKKFFIDNPQYKHMLTDFFMQERLKIFAESFLGGNYTIGEIYNFLYKEVFSRNPQDNVALTAYLFIAASLSKLNKNNLGG
ncbi:MAG: glycosyltransferase [Selenomonadaceae bacterium]|nr:glycosyltransferase [Selenomonadaceae bacterium]